MSSKIKGAEGILYISTRGIVVETPVALADNTWYEIISFGSPTALPDIGVGRNFKSPDSTAAAPITLLAGDSVYLMDDTQMCRVDIDYTADEGVIEATDDCDNGSISNVLDGFVAITGSASGFLRVDEETEELVPVRDEILNRYMDKIDDDAAGVYALTERKNEQLMMRICLNKDAKVGQVQTWLNFPALFNSYSGAAALKGAQSSDVSFSKGQGPATYYKRTVLSAADEI